MHQSSNHHITMAATSSLRVAASRVATSALGSSLLLLLYERINGASEKENEQLESCLAIVGGNSLQKVTRCRIPTSPLYTACEPSREQPEDSYPNFTRHGNHSILKKYLTPQVYQELCDKKTANGITLESIIACGVALPLGANPPRGLGVYVGDAECYTTFSPLLNPMIAEYHGTSEANTDFRLTLRRHSTNLDPEMVLSQRPDPTGEYILYTRMRVARSIQGFVFSPAISRCERRRLDALVQDCVQDWKDTRGKYVTLYDMSNAQHDDLIKRHILFHDPDEWAVYACLGRDWPDSRGIYCNDWVRTPNIMVWCNSEDHIRVISMRKGGDLHGVFTALSQTVQALESSLQSRGHKFVYDERLGYLNTCPTNLGTALRASVFVKLVRLGRQPGFKELAKRLKLQVHTGYGHTDRRYTGIFDVSNAERLGKSEVQLLNIMIQGVGKLIELERKLEKGEIVDLNNIQ
jgi:protein-arginine kinase